MNPEGTTELAGPRARCCDAAIASPESSSAPPARVPPGLDLTGSIVVLTHPRTGSSLLMQTLRLLGADVLGEAERPGVAADANPRGFYEHVPVLLGGLCAAPLAENPALLRGRAFKLSLSTLVHRRCAGEWKLLLQPAVRLLLPLRSPSESLRSQQIFLRTPEEIARRSLHHLASVRQQLLAYGALSQWVGAPEFHRAAPATIDYPLALADPAAYVERVAGAAELHPSEAQRAAALANIDRTLYRFSTPRVAAEQASGERAALLEEVYALLRRDEPDKWRRLHNLLPAWARANSDWPADSA